MSQARRCATMTYLARHDSQLSRRGAENRGFRLHRSSAQVIGEVSIGERSSVWPNSTVRGDVHYIRIGQETNVQDNCCLHVMTGEYPCILGDRVTVGHSVTLHG